MSIRVVMGVSFFAVVTTGCAPAPREPDVPSRSTRSYFMGFSVVPPKPDIKVAVATMGVWAQPAGPPIMDPEDSLASVSPRKYAKDAPPLNGVVVSDYF